MQHHFLSQICPRLRPLSDCLPENIREDPELDPILSQILVDGPNEPLPECSAPQNNLNDVPMLRLIIRLFTWQFQKF